MDEPKPVTSIRKFGKAKSKIKKDMIGTMTLIEYQLGQRLANKNAEYVKLEEQHRMTMEQIRDF